MVRRFGYAVLQLFVLPPFVLREGHGFGLGARDVRVFGFGRFENTFVGECTGRAHSDEICVGFSTTTNQCHDGGPGGVRRR